MSPKTISELVNDEQKLRIGFLGCGTIAKAIATGLATHPSIEHISVTRRSESKSKALVDQFGADKVSIHDDNQSVVDGSDVVFCCVLPKQTSEVLQSINFDKTRHTLISLVSTSTLADLIADSKLDKDQVYKMICLPAVAKHEGITLITPKKEDAILLNLLDTLGGYVQAESEELMSTMMVTSGLMGSLYGILRQNREWLVKQGVPAADASYLVGKMYLSMIMDASRVCHEPHAFDDLVAEQTPGGINEQGLANLSKLGGLDAYDRVCDAMLKRIQGKSDGSLDLYP